MEEEKFKKNDRREIFGWLAYDWANSAFYTTVVSVLLAPYLTSLAQAHIGENGVIFDFGFLGAVTAKNLFFAEHHGFGFLPGSVSADTRRDRRLLKP